MLRWPFESTFARAFLDRNKHDIAHTCAGVSVKMPIILTKMLIPLKNNSSFRYSRVGQFRIHNACSSFGSKTCFATWFFGFSSKSSFACLVFNLVVNWMQWTRRFFIGDCKSSELFYKGVTWCRQTALFWIDTDYPKHIYIFTQRRFSLEYRVSSTFFIDDNNFTVVPDVEWIDKPAISGSNFRLIICE